MSVIPAARLFAWLGCVAVVSIVRVVLGEIFHRAAPGGPDIVRWRGYFMASAFILCGKRP